MTIKHSIAILAALLPHFTGAADEPVPSTPPAPVTDEQRLSYATGANVARSLRRQGVAVDPDLFARGFREAYLGRTLVMTDEEIQKAMTAELGVLRRQSKFGKPIAANNQREGATFLAANKVKEGVVTLPSGLQYKVVRSAGGKKPADGDTVECQYSGALLDGTVVDATSPGDARAPAKPRVFKVYEAIPGLREALKLMPAGARWQVWLPPALGYGSRWAERSIAPNSTLVYDVELLGVK